MPIDFETLLDRYAEIIVKIGLNLQPGQRLLMGHPIRPVPFEAAPLVRLVSEKAYRLGCPLVQPMFGDEKLALTRLQHADAGTLEAVPEWIYSGYLSEVSAGAALLVFSGADPDLLAGEDPQKTGLMFNALLRAHEPISKITGSYGTSWLVVAVPTPGWARRVFPDLPAEEAVSRLWQLVFSACRVDQPDPVAAWKAHLDSLAVRREVLTARQYARLHYRASGTDLTVDLPPQHIWDGGSSHTQAGPEFCPNLPTEEVYTLPHKDGVNGIVSATRPFSWMGSTIDGARLTFSGGRVTQAEAARGVETLRQVLATDEGAARLGEVALVPASSPISQTGVIFRNILFDENAACHFALGSAYRPSLAGGTTLSDEVFAARGGNLSKVHLDFMVGSGELDVDGIYSDGRSEALLRRGEWV